MNEPGLATPSAAHVGVGMLAEPNLFAAFLREWREGRRGDGARPNQPHSRADESRADPARWRVGVRGLAASIAVWMSALAYGQEAQ